MLIVPLGITVVILPPFPTETNGKAVLEVKTVGFEVNTDVVDNTPRVSNGYRIGAS